MTHDQPDTAACVELIGAGVSISPKNYTAQTVSEKLDSMISSPNVIARCREFALRINPAQSLQETCDLIENFASLP